jgi:hypothetical protein
MILFFYSLFSLIKIGMWLAFPMGLASTETRKIKMNANETCVDFESLYNRVILDCLKLPLGDVLSGFTAFFDQCVVQMSDKSVDICLVNGYRVGVDPDNGIILLAECGAAGVAVRFPVMFLMKLKLNRQEYLEYDGGKQRLNQLYSGESTAWVVSDGSLNMDDVQRGVSAGRSQLASQLAYKATIEAINVERPENAALLAYLKALNASVGSLHPEVLDFVFSDLPRNAGVKVIQKMVEGVWAMVHPETSVILGFYRNEYLYLRLPQTTFDESLNLLDKMGNRAVSAFPEAGAGWVKFGAFSIQEKSPALVAAAHLYAGAK